MANAADAATGPVVFALSEAEAGAYWSALGRRQQRSGRLGFRWLAAFAAPVAVVAVPFALVKGGILAEPILAPLIFCVALAYLAGVFAQRYEMLRAVRRRGRLLYRGNPLFAEERTVRLATEGLEVVSRSLLQVVAYDAITEVEIGPDGMIAWAGTIIGMAVPTRAFGDPARCEAFAVALRARVVLARR